MELLFLTFHAKQFQFSGVMEQDGRYIIHMEPVNLERVAEECDRAISSQLAAAASEDFDNMCSDEKYHTNQCRIGMEEFGLLCIKVEAERAELRRNRLHFLSQLKDCAQEPTKANGLKTLEGWAQESCIYNTK